jgi:hypothetical protein
MFYFTILIILTVLSGFLYNIKIISKKAAVSIISIYAIFLYGIRSENVGNEDVQRYVEYYKQLEFYALSEIGSSIFDDPGFYYLSKLFSMLFPSYNMWFAAIGSVFIISFSTLILKYSNQLILSYLLFYTFVFTLNFSLLRNCVALSFVVSAYVALKEDKNKKAILILSIAPLFHMSSVLAFLMFPLKKARFGTWNFLMIFVAVAISFGLTNFLPAIVEFLNMPRFDYYVLNDVMKLSRSAFFINLMLLVFVLLLILLSSKSKREKYSFELNMFSIGVVFYALVGVLAEFYRIGLFFSYTIILLLPNVLNEFKSSKIKILNYVLSFITGVLLLIYFLFFVLDNHYLLPYEVNDIFKKI